MTWRVPTRIKNPSERGLAIFNEHIEDIRNNMLSYGAQKTQAESQTVAYVVFALAEMAGEDKNVAEYCLERIGTLHKELEEKEREYEAKEASLVIQENELRVKYEKMARELKAHEEELTRREKELSDMKRAIESADDPVARAMVLATEYRNRLLKGNGVENEYARGLAQIFSAAVR